MNHEKMIETLLKSGAGETARLTGGIAALLPAMRYFKKEKIAIKGGIEYSGCGLKGTNIRKINLADPLAMSRVFGWLADKTEWPISKPIVDMDGNGIIGTNGWAMLVSRVPDGFPVDKAAESGFRVGTEIRWREIAGGIEPTDSVLSRYRRAVTIKKGGEKHGLAQAFNAAVKAYEFTAQEGFLNTLRLRIGAKYYDARSVCDIVDLMFKLGHDTVALCEDDGESETTATSPMSVFGFGGEVAAKGCIMPLLGCGPSTGAFVMPRDGLAGEGAA